VSAYPDCPGIEAITLVSIQIVKKIALLFSAFTLLLGDQKGISPLRTAPGILTGLFCGVFSPWSTVEKKTD